MMPKIIVYTNSEAVELGVPVGSNLREQLLANGLSPYGKISDTLNCGGNGICATCGVYIIEGDADPVHWHDRLASRFRYPRLTCQIVVTGDMTIQLLDDKWIWGNRHPKAP